MASPDSAGTDASPPGRLSRWSDTSRKGSGSHRTARRRGSQSASLPAGEGDHRFNTARRGRLQIAADKVDGKTTRPLIRVVFTRRPSFGKPPSRCGWPERAPAGANRRLRAPVKTVAEVQFVARLHRLFRLPEADDIIQRFAGSWDLHQADRPFAPLVTRLNPQAGTLVIPAHHIPGSGRNHGPAATDQSRAGSCPEGIELQLLRVIQRPADPFPLPNHIDSRSESWICGWMVSHIRRSLLPQLNILVIGAIPSCLISLRAYRWFSTSMITRVSGSGW